MGIFRKYLWAIGGSVSLFLLISGMIEMYFVYRESMSYSSRQQLAKAESVRSHVEEYFNGVERTLSHAAVPVGIAQTMGKGEWLSKFWWLFKTQPAISVIEFIDEQGQVILKLSQYDPDIVSKAASSHLTTVSTSPIPPFSFAKPHFSMTGEPYVRVTTRTKIKSGTHQFAAEINLSFLNDVLRNTTLTDDEAAYIVDSEGNILAHTDHLITLSRVQVATMPKGDNSAIGSWQTAHDSSSVFSIGSLIPRTNWMVVVQKPKEVVLAPVYAGLMRTAILVGFGQVLLLALSWTIAGWLTNPIRALTAVATAVGRGNLELRVPVTSRDELGTLAIEFNNMADQIQSYTTSLEQKVSEKTAQLELANRHKSEFLANMSHELRTPLNAVIGFSDVLKEQYFGALNPKQHEYVKDINESGQHLLSLINDILDLSKIEAGHMDLDLSEFSVPMAIDNAMVLVRERALRHQLQLRADIAADVTNVVADQRKFKQILINLLTNAVKFSYPNGWVEVVARRDTNGIVVTVKDTGMGIAAEDQAAIFEEFRQVKTSDNAKLEGTGLGLSLAKRLVELHGGLIWVESVPGMGAAFSFTFPDRVLVSEGATSSELSLSP